MKRENMKETTMEFLEKEVDNEQVKAAIAVEENQPASLPEVEDSGMTEEEAARRREELTVKRRTYGILGLMEWQARIPGWRPGLPEISIQFQGGQISGYGVAPARYTTEDPMIQRWIENTTLFKTGKIYLLESREDLD